MSNIEKYQLFLMFLEMNGVLGRYQDMMNSPIEDRWYGVYNPYPKLTNPMGWIVDAFSWDEEGDHWVWSKLNEKWEVLVETL